MSVPAASTAADELCEELYARYRDDVYRYTLALLRRPADAEDATQTTFLNAYRAIARGDQPWKPKHWLIAIAHNACRTRAIRASRRPHEVPLEWGLAVAGPEDADPTTLRELLHALAELPDNQRKALVQRELGERSYAEIAESLGVTVAAVETLIFRARRTLRRRRSLLRGGWLAWLPAWAHRLAAPFAGSSAPEAVAIAAAAATLAVGAGSAAPAQHRHHAARLLPSPVLFDVSRPPARPPHARPAAASTRAAAAPAAPQPPPAAPPSPPPAARADPAPASAPAPATAPAPDAPEPPAPGPSDPAPDSLLPPLPVSEPSLPAVQLPAVPQPPPVELPPALPVDPSAAGTGQVPALSGI